MRGPEVERATSMPAAAERAYAGRAHPGRSLTFQLARGAIGFGLIGLAIALTRSLGPTVLLLVPLGAVALGGCPTCWLAGLIETVSAGRAQRACAEDGCELRISPHLRDGRRAAAGG